MPSALARRGRRLVLAVSATLVLSAVAPANDYWVDGQKGQDVASGGSTTKPWKTIPYALRQMTRPTYPKFHVIHVVGGQVYSVGAPLNMRYNVRLKGVARPTAPVLRGPSSLSTLVLFPPSETINRKQAGLHDFVLEGGTYAIRMGGAGASRHRPEILYCEFRGQSSAAVRIDQLGKDICDPRFFQCRFLGVPRGIDAHASGDNSVLRPDIDECLFSDLKWEGYRLRDTSTRSSDVGGLVRNSHFVRCLRGIYIESGANAHNTRIDIRSCYFRDNGLEGIEIQVNRPADPAVTVESCSFVRNRSGLLFGGVFTPGLYSITTRNCYAMDNRHAGFYYNLQRTGTGRVQIRVNSVHNLAVGSLLYGFRIAQRNPDLDLVLDSHGDRAFKCTYGMHMSGGGTSASLHFDGGILARNQRYGMYMNSGSQIDLRFMTIADNSVTGLVVAQKPFQPRFDHCLVAGNSTELSVPSGLPICFWNNE